MRNRPWIVWWGVYFLWFAVWESLFLHLWHVRHGWHSFGAIFLIIFTGLLLKDWVRRRMRRPKIQPRRGHQVTYVLNGEQVSETEVKEKWGKK